MFDGKIDFMDFNKIKINYGGKLTCRKIFKRKYIIYLVISMLCLIFLISLYTIKNNKIKGATIEIKEIVTKNDEMSEKINSLRTQNIQEEMKLSESQSQNSIIKNELSMLNTKEKNTKKTNLELLSEKEKLEKQSASLNTQLKTETELKEVYEQKISSLTTLLESLEKEYEKLLEQKSENKEEKTIENSKIINQIEAYGLEKTIKGTIGKKCFDGVENNFSPKIFHEKCDGSAVLVLIKTENNERIGAFSKVSFEGSETKNDPSSVLFNIEKGKHFELGSSEYSTIVCDPNELPQFGDDLQIKSNQQGINKFPSHYGNKNKNKAEELTNNYFFKIENLEIYKIEF